MKHVHPRRRIQVESLEKRLHLTVTQIRQFQDNATLAPLGTVGDQFLYFADDGTHGAELWTTNTKTLATALVKDIHPGTGGSLTNNYSGAAVVNGKLFFSANDGSGATVWQTDGTAAGTLKPLSYIYSGFIRPFSTGFTISSTFDLEYSDGTQAGTHGLAGDVRSNVVELNGYAYYSSPNLSVGKGIELYRSNIATGASSLVKDINPGSGNSAPGSLARFGSQLFFFASPTDSAAYPFRTDGTSDGTVLLTSAVSDGSSSALPTAIGNLVYFVPVYPQGVGGLLWITDGTPNGTHLFSNLAPFWMRSINGRLIFSSYDGSLYATDGTAAGTVKIATTKYDGGSGLTGDQFYFSGFAHNSTSASLWVTDGTAEGTKQIFSSAGGSNYDGWTIASSNNVVFFGSGGTTGRTLYAVTSADTQPPALVQAKLNLAATQPTVAMQFTEPLNRTLTSADIDVRDMVTNSLIPTDAYTLAFAADRCTWSIIFNGTTPLNDSYRATLKHAGIADANGNALPNDVTYDFSLLAGDGNANNSVEITDFNVLAANFGKSGQTFSQGNYDYSADGKITITDFNVLAANFGKHLDPPAGTAAAQVQSFSATAAIGEVSLTSTRQTGSGTSIDDENLLLQSGLI